MGDRPFTHPHLGNEVQVEQHGKEVCLIFGCKTKAQADSVFDDLVRQLRAGTLNLTLMGNPTSIEGFG